MGQVFTRIALGLALGLGAGAAAPARSELPPWVYGDEQRRAPVVAEIRVEQSQTNGQLQTLRARLLSVQRQPAGLLLSPGNLIEVVYRRPTERPMGWVGPSPIPVLQRGTRSAAWLSPLSSFAATPSLRRFAPAAGGKSFGPSFEESFELRPPGRPPGPGQAPGP